MPHFVLCLIMAVLVGGCATRRVAPADLTPDECRGRLGLLKSAAIKEVDRLRVARFDYGSFESLELQVKVVSLPEGPRAERLCGLDVIEAAKWRSVLAKTVCITKGECEAPDYEWRLNQCGKYGCVDWGDGIWVD